jgi:hypothetical protein
MVRISDFLKLRKRKDRKIVKCWSTSDLKLTEKSALLENIKKKKVVVAWSGDEKNDELHIIATKHKRRFSYP